MWDKPGWLNWYWQFLCKVLSSFNLEGFYSPCGSSCSLCEGRTFSCTWLIPRNLCGFLLMLSTGFTSLSVLLLFPLLIPFLIFMLSFWFCLLHSVSYFFFLYWSPSSLCTVFGSISSNIDKVLLINPSANVFVFGDLNINH